MTQKQRIIDYLRHHEYITRRSCAIELDIYELASRIGELEKDGYRFEKEMIYNNNTHYMKYSLVEEEDE